VRAGGAWLERAGADAVAERGSRKRSCASAPVTVRAAFLGAWLRRQCYFIVLTPLTFSQCTTIDKSFTVSCYEEPFVAGTVAVTTHFESSLHVGMLPVSNKGHRAK
jgi:hypothetical protein